MVFWVILKKVDPPKWETILYFLNRLFKKKLLTEIEQYEDFLRVNFWVKIYLIYFSQDTFSDPKMPENVKI